MDIPAFGCASRRRIVGGWLVLAALMADAPAAETILIRQGTAMRYLDNRADPGIDLAWTDPDFDDGGDPWKDGNYAVGYSAGDMIETSVPTATLSVYTRAAFEIADPAAVENVFLGVDYDDGYIAWINGAEVARASMPQGDPAWDESATSHESSNGDSPVYDPLQDVTATAKPVLRAGRNVLAIGAWNVDSGSSDLALAPRLSIDRPTGGGSQVCGTLSGTTTWTAAQSPYVVTCSSTVPKGSTLLIEPGVEVRFDGSVSLTVRGEIHAVGEDGARILFTRNGTSSWSGIVIDHGGDGDPRPSEIRFADLEYASRLVDVVGTGSSEIVIEDCAFDHWTSLAAHWDWSNSIGANALVFRRCAFGLATPSGEQSHEAINGYRSSATIEDSTFGPRRGYNDVIDLGNARWGNPNGVPTVRRSTFLGGEDDAIDFDNSDGIIDGNVIQNYMPSGTAPPAIPSSLPPSGGGANGGGITGNEGSAPLIINNRIRNCFQGIGYKNGAAPTLINNTIVGCTFGVVIFRTDDIGDPSAARAALINNIIWDCGDPIRLKWFDDDPVVSTVDVSYSIVEGGWAGEGNLDADPRLADPAGGDLSLLADSPAIDSGLGTDQVSERDAAGEPRADDPAVPNTGAGTPDYVDRGALERQSGGPPPVLFRRGYANDDVDLNISDAVSLLSFIFANGSVPCQRACDVNGDGAIDIGDPIVLLTYLFASGPPPAAPFETCGTAAGDLSCEMPTGGCEP
ncbi:MAG: right-handed parallel beta-helix repeat-containing protein [Planctomycetes bacterium]|nr:right-handed parallel beta-helix repeat-containing protein [Planctomycetota bacterium]